MLLSFSRSFGNSGYAGAHQNKLRHWSFGHCFVVIGFWRQRSLVSHQSSLHTLVSFVVGVSFALSIEYTDTMSITVPLSDGEKVNLCTNEGASAFFAANPKFLSVWTEQASQLVKNTDANRKGKSNSSNQLIVLYQLLGVMAESLSTSQLATLQVDEVQCLVDFVLTRFGEVSYAPTWRSTGTLCKPDQELLDSIVPWLKHAKFVQLMLSSGGFDTIAELVARDENNKPTMPIPEVTETILMITNNAILTLKGNSSTQAFSSKRHLMELEETGLLGQALRCLTVPVRHGSLSEYLQIVDLVESNTRLLEKRFVPGTRTGDILQGLLAGNDGWTTKSSNSNHEVIMKRLQGLAKLAIASKRSMSPEDYMELTRICRHCGKTGWELAKESDYKRLLPCSKCKVAFFCNKTCQRADYKEHKKTCRPILQPIQSKIMSFIQQNYVPIMTEIKETCVSNSLDKKDLFLEIDFMHSDDNGSSAAMNGEFRVILVTQALEGDCPDEPDWFYKGTDVYESNVALFRAGLRDHHNRMTPNHILVAYRGPEGNAGVYRVDCMSEKTGLHICSDEALDLFPLDSLEKKMKFVMLQSGQHPVGGESEEDLKKFIETFGGGMKV